MKNVEKYKETKDALKAWNKYHDGGGDMPFAGWAEQEASLPTLLEAAAAVKTTWDSRWQHCSLSIVEKAFSDLSDAIDREKEKPVRNCDRYGTAKEAFYAFEKMCSTNRCCEDCHFDRLRLHCGLNCRFLWLYAEAGKEVAE